MLIKKLIVFYFMCKMIITTKSSTRRPLPETTAASRHPRTTAQPARRRKPPARCTALRPRAGADGQDIALRFDGIVAATPANLARRDQSYRLPALSRHGPYPQRGIVRAAYPAHLAGRGDEGEHSRCARAGASGRRDVP